MAEVPFNPSEAIALTHRMAPVLRTMQDAVALIETGVRAEQRIQELGPRISAAVAEAEAQEGRAAKARRDLADVSQSLEAERGRLAEFLDHTKAEIAKVQREQTERTQRAETVDRGQREALQREHERALAAAKDEHARLVESLKHQRTAMEQEHRDRGRELDEAGAASKQALQAEITALTERRDTLVAALADLRQRLGLG